MAQPIMIRAFALVIIIIIIIMIRAFALVIIIIIIIIITLFKSQFILAEQECSTN